MKEKKDCSNCYYLKPIQFAKTVCLNCKHCGEFWKSRESQWQPLDFNPITSLNNHNLTNKC